ncbi:MAG TPA: tetratricopeptide repeat protein, partial [Blastocatellia bacterium]|nr:tetratricopeptide repeat protein [Blastocatellia bacterium]
MSSNKADALRRAEQLAGQGDFKAAIAVYRGLIEADPLDLNSIHSLTDLYVRAGYVQEALDELTRLADRAMALGPAIHAAPLLVRMLDLDPSNAPLRMKLAAVYARAGRPEQAHQTYIEAGAAFARRGNFVAATEAVKSALAIKPDSQQARAALASLNQQVAPQAAAQPLKPSPPKMRGTSELAELGKQLSAAPGNFSAADVTDEFIVRQLFAAELLAGCGDTDKAVALLKRLLDFRPDAIDVRTKLKDIYLRADRIAEASREFLEIARVYESHGDAVRAKDFSVRAERLAQQRAEPPRAANVRPIDVRPVERPAEANAKQITTAQAERIAADAVPIADTATAQPASPIGVATGPLALNRPEPTVAAAPVDDGARSQRGRIVFYAVAAAIVITLLSGWFFARRWYAEELDRAYQTLARANSLPLPPQTTNGEPFTMPRSEERMDVRAESPSSSPNAAGAPAQPSAPAQDEAAPRDERDREPTPAASPNPNPSEAKGSAATAPKPTAPPVVAVAPNVATNSDGAAPKGPASLPRNDSAEPPPPPAETRKATVIVKAEALQRVQPDYPTSARAARQAGMVAVEVSINERGDVVAAQVTSGPSLL